MQPIYLFLAEGFEDIEAIAVIDILRRAELPLKTVSISDQKKVYSAHCVGLEADLLFSEANLAEAQLLILPGGLPGAHNLADYPPLNEAILGHAKAEKPLAAICAAPLVFGRLGLLEGKKCTCYPGFESELTGATCTGNMVECDGLFITGKSPGAAMEFAYTLVARFASQETANMLRQGMLYQG